MKKQMHNVITVFVSVIISLILSVLNVVSLGWLQLCQFKGQLLLEYYYFIPIIVFIGTNTLLYNKYRKTDLKTGLLILELILLCTNVWFVRSTSIPLNCLIDTTAKRIYAVLYYVLLLFDLMVPLAFLFGLIMEYKKTDKIK